MKTNLAVQDLDYDKIKSNLIEYLKSQDEFQDYVFEGSSLSVLMNLLAYTTHYNGFFAHMLAKESFVNSAALKSSLTARAKFLNYIPKSKQAARATVTLSASVDDTNEPVDHRIVVERGTTVRSNNNSSDGRTFVVTDDVYIYNKAEDGSYDYRSDDVTLYEGTYETERFIVDNTLVNQRFIIQNDGIDINTLQLDVYNARGDTEFSTYKLASDFTEINRNSKVYFLSMNEEDKYEIFFGNDVYGKALAHGNMVVVTFVSTNGPSGNNAKSFTFGGDYGYGGQLYSITITPESPSEGGLDAETVEDLRYNIPYHHRRQNRSVNVDDYKNTLLTQYRNINSINVWGGEDNVPVEYGKVFISIKPKYGEVLSSKAKSNIVDKILRKYGVLTIEPVIIDPDYLYVNLDVTVRFNPLLTNKSAGEIRTLSINTIDDYNTNVLNRFGSFYSDSVLMGHIQKANPAIMTSYTRITLEKRFTPNLNVPETYLVDFINELKPGTIESETFTYRLRECYFADDSKGNIVVYYYETGKKTWIKFPDETFGSADYTNGVVRLTGLEVNGLSSTMGKMSVYAKPVYPDFFTKRNNVIVINDVSIATVEDHGNNG